MRTPKSCFQTTYEELKPKPLEILHNPFRFQTTYEELKPLDVDRFLMKVRFQTTYEELKREMKGDEYEHIDSFQTTYEELKHANQVEKLYMREPLPDYL